jgi:pimeloyl-ACP methyl ester carboxylesterase
MRTKLQVSDVAIPVGRERLNGELVLPSESSAVILFAHGSGSSRHSPRNQYVARVLHEAKLGTLLFDLLTPEEEKEDYYTRHLRFDVHLLANRLIAATDWLEGENLSEDNAIGYFGSSTGAAAALVAAAQRSDRIGAVVSRGGRPDLAAEFLAQVNAPTLLIVGGNDTPVIELNEQAYAQLRCEKELRLVPGATHLFEEAGALEKVSHLASDWFATHLMSAKANVS